MADPETRRSRPKGLHCPRICLSRCVSRRMTFRLKKFALAISSATSIILLAIIIQPACLDCKHFETIKAVQFKTAKPVEANYTVCGPCTSVQLSNWRWLVLAGILIHFIGLMGSTKSNIIGCFTYMLTFNIWVTWLAQTDISLAFLTPLPERLLLFVYIAAVNGILAMFMYELFKIKKRRAAQKRTAETMMTFETDTSENLEFDFTEVRMHAEQNSPQHSSKTKRSKRISSPSPTVLSVPAIKLNPPVSLRRSNSDNRRPSRAENQRAETRF